MLNNNSTTTSPTSNTSPTIALHSALHQLTMSSREIAELTGKRHDHVIRDIELMFLRLNIDAPKFGDYYKASNGKRNLQYHLPKREALILVSGYSVELRARIIDRWTELEELALEERLKEVAKEVGRLTFQPMSRQTSARLWLFLA